MAKKDKPTKENSLEELKWRITALQILSGMIILLGVICFAFGIPTVVLTTTTPAYPFSSGSGIYSGILVILAGVFGFLFLKEATAESPSKLKCYNITYRVFLTIGLDLGAVHFAYGIWSVVVCSRGYTEPTCGGVNWSANYLLAAVNMTVGLTILVVCIVAYVICWKLWKVTWQMSKVQGGQKMASNA